MQLPVAQPERTSQEGWSTIVSGTGDDDNELLRFNIAVKNFSAAALVGSELASLIVEHDELYTQVTLRSWRVEVNIGVPKGLWSSIAQQKLATEISRRYH